MMDIKVDLLQWFIIFLIKTSDSGINNEIKQNEQLVGEPRKPNIRKFGGVYFLFQYNIYIYIFLFFFFWGGGGGGGGGEIFADIQLISKFSKEVS